MSRKDKHWGISTKHSRAFLTRPLQKSQKRKQINRVHLSKRIHPKPKTRGLLATIAHCPNGRYLIAIFNPLANFDFECLKRKESSLCDRLSCRASSRAAFSSGANPPEARDTGSMDCPSASSNHSAMWFQTSWAGRWRDV
jgi:hypothetical protein